ncbi:MAG: hypothetical protein II540_01005 [Paludibacteraceae bacterium]|nr:hypothetical protein [Paludibacteraceae bacterium]
MICLISLHVNALIVSINDYGDIPDTGMEITLTEAEEDVLTGEITAELSGTLLCNEPLTVTINRSVTGIEDEFCCAGECTAGNGQMTETLHFTPNGPTNWFTHFQPANSFVTIVYTFSTASESRTLTVHYNITQGLDDVQSDKTSCKKFILNGLLLIQQGNKIYHL